MGVRERKWLGRQPVSCDTCSPRSQRPHCLASCYLNSIPLGPAAWHRLCFLLAPVSVLHLGRQWIILPFFLELVALKVFIACSWPCGGFFSPPVKFSSLCLLPLIYLLIPQGFLCCLCSLLCLFRSFFHLLSRETVSPEFVWSLCATFSSAPASPPVFSLSTVHFLLTASTFIFSQPRIILSQQCVSKSYVFLFF